MFGLIITFIFLFRLQSNENTGDRSKIRIRTAGADQKSFLLEFNRNRFLIKQLPVRPFVCYPLGTQSCSKILSLVSELCYLDLNYGKTYLNHQNVQKCHIRNLPNLFHSFPLIQSFFTNLLTSAFSLTIFCLWYLRNKLFINYYK